MLLASTAAGLPDWDLPSLSPPEDVALSRLFCHFWFVPVAFSAGHGLTTQPWLMWTRLASSSQRPTLVLGLKPRASCLAQGPFCPARCYWIALEFFSSFLDSWSRPRDSFARLITFSSPLGLWKKTACLWGSATLSVHCFAFQEGCLRKHGLHLSWHWSSPQPRRQLLLSCLPAAGRVSC